MPNLHAVKTETGVAIVDREPGPYSAEPPTDRVVFELTAEELAQVQADLAAMEQKEHGEPTA